MREAASTPSQWDYEWRYTDGLLSSNGWTKTVNRTASETMDSNGLKLTSDANSYIRLKNDDYNMVIGEMEVALVVPQSSTDKTSQNIRICLSNGTNGLTLLPNTGKWRILDVGGNVSVQNGTALADFAVNTEYVIRIRLNNGYASAWINGTQVLTGFDLGRSFYSTNTAVWSQNQGGGYGIFKSIKLLVNRISD